MNQRTQQKLKTRERILAIAKEMVLEQGALDLTTLDLAKEAGVANGTIFLHFGTREELIGEVFSSECKRIVQLVREQVEPDSPPLRVLSDLLTAMSTEEDFLEVMLRELPFHPSDIRNQILGAQMVMRNLLYRSLEADGISSGRIRPILDAVFALIEHYLRSRSLLSGQPQILPNYRDDILRLFQLLTQQEESMNAPKCESCGMPMERPEQFGGGRIDNRYCVFCTDSEGNLKSFSEKLTDFTRFTMARMGMDEDKARELARTELLRQPAWQHLRKDSTV
jgi:AcrR family transcriptional regulator